MDETSSKEQNLCPSADNEPPQPQPQQPVQQQQLQSENEASIGTSTAPTINQTASSISSSAAETMMTVDASNPPFLPDQESFSPDRRETTPMTQDTTCNLPPSPAQATSQQQLHQQPQMEQQASSKEQESQSMTETQQQQQQQQQPSEPSSMLFGFTTNARTSGPSITKNNILEAIKDFDSSIPDAVVHHFLNVAGMQTSDQRIIRLIAIAAQKFIHDIISDSLQHCKLRGVQGKKTKDKKYTLAIEDLASALAEYGIEVRRQHYFN